MAKKHKLASVLSSVNETIGKPVSVLANSEVALHDQSSVVAHVCNSCSTTAGYNVPSPFCVTCGSDDLTQISDEPEVLDEEQSLASVECSNCGTHNIMSDSVTAALGGSIHCTACSTHLQYAYPENIDAPADDPDFDFDPTASVDVTEEGEEGDENPQLPSTATEHGGEEDEDEDDGEDDGADADVPEEENAGDDPDGSVINEDQEELDLVDQATAEDPDAEFEAFEGAGRVYASLNGLPVAVLTPETAGSNADNMFKPSFLRAVAHTVEQVGVRKALADFGFTPLKVVARVDSMVAKRAEAATAGVMQDLQEEREQLRANLMQSLQIASVGLNKGFWPNRSNALKATMYEVLQQANVRHPERLVDSVFAASGEAYNQELLEQAEELMEKSPEVLNELASSLQVVPYKKAELDDEDPDSTTEDDVDGPEAVEARLLGSGLKSVQRRETAGVPTKIPRGLFAKA